jgi:hypothetical protein
MVTTAMSEPLFDDDALLVLEQPGSWSALQSADIVLGTATGITAAVRWIRTTFDTCPGCVVVGAYDVHGEWALLATSTESRTLVRAGRAGLSWRTITALAHLVYNEEVRP